MNVCRRCGAAYGPNELVTVPLRALPTIQVSGIDGARCTGCGDLRYAIPRMEDLLRTVVGLLVRKPERLSGREARFLRKWLGWSGQDTADRLGFTPEHVSRWENDKVPISETADKLLRTLVLVRQPIDDYAEWDARLAVTGKADAEPLPVHMVTDGHTWSPAA